MGGCDSKDEFVSDGIKRTFPRPHVVPSWVAYLTHAEVINPAIVDKIENICTKALPKFTFLMKRISKPLWLNTKGCS